MKRDTVIASARVAGYHGDTARFTRLIVEGRVNRQTMNQAYQAGARAKERGVPCDCHECHERFAESHAAAQLALVIHEYNRS